VHPARHHGPFYPRTDGPGSPLGRGVLPWPRTWPWRADWIREGSLAGHDMAVYLSNNGNASAMRNAQTITECDEQSASHWLRLLPADFVLAKASLTLRRLARRASGSAFFT
jgi:hypothetical protein